MDGPGMQPGPFAASTRLECPHSSTCSAQILHTHSVSLHVNEKETYMLLEITALHDVARPQSIQGLGTYRLIFLTRNATCY